MNTRMTDEALPVGRLTRVKDSLPPPDQLVMPEDTVKVTLLLSRTSIKFFKRQAGRHGTKYQRMIRRLLDHYAEQYSK